MIGRSCFFSPFKVEPASAPLRGARGWTFGHLASLGSTPAGSISGPHLHFHVADRINPLAAEGVPYVIDGWALMRGTGKWELRTNELPVQNERVRFPGN